MKLKRPSTKNSFGKQMASPASTAKCSAKVSKHQQQHKRQQQQPTQLQQQQQQQHKVPIYNLSQQTLPTSTVPAAVTSGATSRPPLKPLSPASVLASARRFLPATATDNAECDSLASCTECSINCCCSNLMNSCCYMPSVLMPMTSGVGSNSTNTTSSNLLSNLPLTSNSEQVCDDSTPYVYQEPEENFVSIDDAKIKNFLVTVGQQKQKQKLLQQKQLQQQQHLLKQQQQLQLQQQQLEKFLGLEKNYTNRQHLSNGVATNHSNQAINANNGHRRPVVYEIIELDDEDERERLKRIKMQAEQSQLHKQIQSTLAKANTEIILESVRHPPKSLDISLIPKYPEKNTTISSTVINKTSPNGGAVGLRKRTAKSITNSESVPTNRRRLDPSKQRIIAEIDLLDSSSSDSSGQDQQELSDNRVAMNNSYRKGKPMNGSVMIATIKEEKMMKSATNYGQRISLKCENKDGKNVCSMNVSNYGSRDNLTYNESEGEGVECEENEDDENLNNSNHKLDSSKDAGNECGVDQVIKDNQNYDEVVGRVEEQRIKTEYVSNNFSANANLLKRLSANNVLVLGSDDDEQVGRQSGQNQVVVRRWHEYRDHRGRLLYECFVCGRTVQSSYNLRRHMMIHTGERPFACDICERKFREFSDLKKHRRRHINEKDFLCMICRKLRPLDNDATRCINCCTQSKHAVLLAAMKTNAQKTDKTKEMEEVITLLQNKVNNESKRANKKAKNMTLTQHTSSLSQSTLETDSSASLLSQSGVCQMGSVSSNDMIDYNAAQKVEVEVDVNIEEEEDEEEEVEADTETEEDDYAELETDTEFEMTAPNFDVTNKIIGQHFLDKIPAVRRRGYNQLGLICRKEFPCPLCKRSFGSRHNLKRHYMIHTGEKPYTCLQCRKPFREYSTLKKHMVTHQKDRWYKCICCPCKFRDFVDFTEHKSTHPFLRTASGANLINNSLIVVNDDQSESGSNSSSLPKQGCLSVDRYAQIKQQVEQNGSLQDDEELSSDLEDWLECGGCGKYFIDLDKYTEHLQLGQCLVRIVHECYICKEQFQSRELLSQHMQQQHNASIADLVEKEESDAGGEDEVDQESSDDQVDHRHEED